MERVPYIEDTEQENKYRDMERLGRELGIPVPRTFLEIEVFDSKGNTLHAQRQRSHSWNRNAYNYLAMAITLRNPTGTAFGAGTLSLKDTGGSIRGNTSKGISSGRSSSSTGIDFERLEDGTATSGLSGSIRASATRDHFGIVVGSSGTAESFEHHNLGSLIGHGSGAGQLDYQSTQSFTFSYDGVSKTAGTSLVRFFNNNSGSSVAVNEVGLIYRLCADNYMYIYNFLFSRDVMASTITVPDTGQLKVTYAIEMVFPA
ncbi:MAG: hypothetical protein JW954_08095 [Dehalococcoidaceae bacterium]|nr:hypothetical protein [Dehalococcoidaceae bacterium]